uniref:Reverse transcriptase domain-containing protein n=1 Tax=Haemonchus contortus TaxID=6289 RepID=A0A7I4YNI2_HAECO
MISLVNDMYNGSMAAVRTAHAVGVHQGLALSPFLFLLTMDVITEELEGGPLKTILQADDIALIAVSKENFHDKLQNGRKCWRNTPAELEEN